MKIFDELHKINGKIVIVRREDLVPNAANFKHGKMPPLEALMKSLKGKYQRVGCFASAGSNWVEGLPILSKKFGLFSIVCCAATKPINTPAFIHMAARNGAEIVRLRPNRTPINTAQARKIVEGRGGFFIPFGLNTPAIVDFWTERFSFPDNTSTLILSVGSGISMLCVLKHLEKYGKHIGKIYGVSAGRPLKSIMQTLKGQLSSLPDFVQIVEEFAYDERPPLRWTGPLPWAMNPHYELKAFAWMLEHIKKLRAPIRFLNIGP